MTVLVCDLPGLSDTAFLCGLRIDLKEETKMADQMHVTPPTHWVAIDVAKDLSLVEWFVIMPPPASEITRDSGISRQTDQVEPE